MKKHVKIENLDCANCAAKLELTLAKIEGVNSVSVNFMAQKMLIDIEDSAYDKVVEKVKAAVRKSEPDCALKGI